MTPALVMACLWVLVAGVVTILPRRFHWPAAAVLIVTGVPILFLIFRQNGVWIGGLALMAALSVLRWPVIRLLQRLRVAPRSNGG